MSLITRLLHRSFVYGMQARMRGVMQPRKPRHRLLRVLLGTVGVALLAALLVVAVVLGGAMLLGALAWRSLRPRRMAASAPALDGEYRVVAPPVLPVSR